MIDAETNTVVATIGVHGRPYFIDVAEDGKRAYVANSGSSNVSVIDLERRTVDRERPRRRFARTGAGFARRLDRRGSQSWRQHRLHSSTPRSLRVRATLPVCQQPEEIAILPDSSKAFVSCSGSSQVASIQLRH